MNSLCNRKDIDVPCAKCHMLKEKHCLAYEKAKEVLKRPLPPPPLSACMLPIVDEYIDNIKEGMRVLEIGCGSWDVIKVHCENVGAYYDGIDTQKEYFGEKTIATRIGSLAELSFPDEYFDIVIGTQTMEHWAENGCSLQWGLYQCFRVCRSGGLLLLNVPIHFHGTKEFMLGKIDLIRNLLSKYSSEASFCKWGSPSTPIPPFYPFYGYGRLKNKPSYVLSIHAVKNCTLPSGISNNWAMKGYLAQILRYPLSFNIYRLLRKIGFFNNSINQPDNSQ